MLNIYTGTNKTRDSEEVISEEVNFRDRSSHASPEKETETLLDDIVSSDVNEFPTSEYIPKKVDLGCFYVDNSALTDESLSDILPPST